MTAATMSRARRASADGRVTDHGLVVDPRHQVPEIDHSTPVIGWLNGQHPGREERPPFVLAPHRHLPLELDGLGCGELLVPVHLHEDEGRKAATGGLDAVDDTPSLVAQPETNR